MITVISGIGPGFTGASRFFKGLMETADADACKFIYPGNYSSPKKDNKFSFFIWVLRWILQRFIFLLRVLFCNKSDVLLIHPQSVGYLTSIYIFIVSKKIRYYVLDSSFFCVRSYNYRKSVGECTDCVGFSDLPKVECNVAPGKTSKYIARLFQKKLYLFRQKIYFYLQNESQKKLLEAHLGHIDCEVVGMNTGELNKNYGEGLLPEKFSEKLKSENLQGFLVFHANLLPAKGFDYALKLAEECKDYLFVFPDKKPDGYYSDVKNILFYPVSWESGLCDLVKEANGVLCLSAWSAPIEGALIKSLLFGKKVFAMQTKYGYSQELSESGLYYLTGDSHKDSEFLKKTLHGKDTAINVDYVKKIIVSTNMSKIYT